MRHIEFYGHKYIGKKWINNGFAICLLPSIWIHFMKCKDDNQKVHYIFNIEIAFLFWELMIEIN